jgi:hypothetical protein
MNDWSDLAFQAANHFIHRQIRRYPYHMDYEECIQECWRAFLIAKRTYPQVAGCCNFAVYAERCILEALDFLRRRRNQRIALESRLSLDMRYDGYGEAIGERYFRKTGDFTNAVALWDFAQRLGEIKYHILLQLYDRLEDWEIIEENRMLPEHYYALVREMQEDFAEWEKI